MTRPGRPGDGFLLPGAAGRRRVSLAAGRLRGSRKTPLTRHRKFRFRLNVIDVYRNRDFDCIGGNQGIRS